MSKILEINNLSFGYESEKAVLKELNFSMIKGDKIGLVGANGAGKSTLLKLLAGVLTPSSGEIYFMGQKLERKTLALARQSLGYVFQNPEDQLFMPTVYEDLSFGLKHRGENTAQIESKVDVILERFGIAHLKHRSNLKLSGGEKRTVALAVAMISNPELIVLDEPTAALDPRARRQLITQLNHANDTMLIASHDLDFIWDTCYKVLILHEGRVLAIDQTATILSQQELLEKAHLELPLRLQHCPNCQIQEAKK